MAAQSSIWVREDVIGTVCLSAGGGRDVLIIGSDVPLPHRDAVSRCNIELTEDDRRRLTNQGIPESCYDDLSILCARYSLDRANRDLVGVEVSEPGKELSRDNVLKQIASLMNNTTKPGAVVYYFGHGRKNTGDWCFKDGYIAFKDILMLYNKIFRGHVLSIVSDCSHSGNWVRACCEYLDEQGVTLCGHSVCEKGLLLKVFASCRPGEIAATPCFSVRAAANDKNTGCLGFKLSKELRDTQHSYGFDFTQVTCEQKVIDKPCTLPPESGTWLMRTQGTRLFLVNGNDRGRPAWHYVILVDDEDIIKEFVQKTQGENAGRFTVNLNNFGQVVKSGWGKYHPMMSRMKWKRSTVALEPTFPYIAA